jgi:hypothetical protein
VNQRDKEEEGRDVYVYTQAPPGSPALSHASRRRLAILRLSVAIGKYTHRNNRKNDTDHFGKVCCRDQILRRFHAVTVPK